MMEHSGKPRQQPPPLPPSSSTQQQQQQQQPTKPRKHSTISILSSASSPLSSMMLQIDPRLIPKSLFKFHKVNLLKLLLSIFFY